MIPCAEQKGDAHPHEGFETIYGVRKSSFHSCHLLREWESYSEEERSLWQKKKSSSSWTMRISTERLGRKGIVWTITICCNMSVRIAFSSMLIATSPSIQGMNIDWMQRSRSCGVPGTSSIPRWVP